MSFLVYAFRERGSLEVRYIGQTGKTPQGRLTFERNYALKRVGSKWARVSPFDLWLAQADIETVILLTAETREQARAKERDAVCAFARLGHRLFNSKLVPAECRKLAEAA